MLLVLLTPLLISPKTENSFCDHCAQDGSSHHTTPHQSFSIPKQQVQPDALLSWLPHQLCHSGNLLDDLKGEHCSGEDSFCSQDLSSLFFKTFPDRNPQLLYCSPRPVSPLGNHCQYWSTCHCGPGVTMSSGIITSLGD